MGNTDIIIYIVSDSIGETEIGRASCRERV